MLHRPAEPILVYSEKKETLEVFLPSTQSDCKCKEKCSNSKHGLVQAFIKQGHGCHENTVFS